MKITLAGTPGSGKSTIRQMLADHYGLDVKATGDIMRVVAKRHGYKDITRFLVEYVSSHPEIDHEFDAEQKLYGQTHDHFVLDAHLGFYFVPDSLKICLVCEFEEAGKRIFKANRETEGATTIAEAVITSRKRRVTMRRNFLNLYNVDIDNFEQFDLVIDTTNLNPRQVFDKLTHSLE